MTKYKAILSGKRIIYDSFIRRGLAFRRLGGYLFSPQVLHESAFLDAWVLTCQNGRREPDYLNPGVVALAFHGSVVYHTAESTFRTSLSLKERNI